MELYEILMLYLIIMSLITFVFYVIDKKRATKGTSRIKEATLLALSILGGGFGGFIAMNLYSHKTRKWYFVITNIASIVGYVYLVLILIQNK